MLEQVLMFTMVRNSFFEHTEICSGNFFIESEGTDRHMIEGDRCKIRAKLQVYLYKPRTFNSQKRTCTVGQDVRFFLVTGLLSLRF